MSLKKLLDLISKLRLVKHGDTILSDDHNSLVNVSKTIQELILPSAVSPEILGWKPHFFDNFLSPSSGLCYPQVAFFSFSYFSNVFETSLAKPYLLPSPTPYVRFVPAWELNIGYSETIEFPIIINHFATVSKPLPFEEVNLNAFSVVYDVFAFLINAMGKTVNGIIYLIYSNEGGHIVVYDTNNMKGQLISNKCLPYTTYTKVDDDVFFGWIISEIGVNPDGTYHVRVSDKDGKELIYCSFVGVTQQETMNFKLTSGGEIIYNLNLFGGDCPILPKECVYDWIALSYSPPI